MERLEIVSRHIDLLSVQKERVIIAIDGKCASGKTTLAAQLSKKYNCNVFRMDDFFLRPEQRTQERYMQIGGNVDYERFNEEVLLPLLSGRAFSYRPFDCQTFTLGAPESAPVKKLNIVEGTYSMHPYFSDPYHLKLLTTVDPDTQRRRILERPAFLHERFFTQWIPLENDYFEKLRIADKADLIL